MARRDEPGNVPRTQTRSPLSDTNERDSAHHERQPDVPPGPRSSQLPPAEQLLRRLVHARCQRPYVVLSAFTALADAETAATPHMLTTRRRPKSGVRDRPTNGLEQRQSRSFEPPQPKVDLGRQYPFEDREALVSGVVHEALDVREVSQRKDPTHVE